MDSMSSSAPLSPMVLDVSSPRMLPLSEGVGSVTGRSQGSEISAIGTTLPHSIAGSGGELGTGLDNKGLGVRIFPSTCSLKRSIVSYPGITPLSYGSFSGLKIGPTIPMSQMSAQQQQHHHEQQRQQQQLHHGPKGAAAASAEAQQVATKEGGLGSRWPKGMWDNMDGEFGGKITGRRNLHFWNHATSLFQVIGV